MLRGPLPSGGNVDPRTVGTGVLETLRLAAERRPVVLVIDDLPWLDAASSDALEFALRRLGDRAVALIATIRTEPGGDLPGPARAIDAERRTELTVGPISQGLLHRLIRDRTGVVLTRPQLVRLETAAGGNPLLALELAAALGRLDRWPRTGEPLPVPGTSQFLLAERLGRLAEPDRDVLFLAAAMASPTLTDLRALRGPTTDDAVARAERDGLLVVEATGRIRFGHPLMAEAALAGVTPDRRRALHAELAAATADVEDRGRHLALAADGPSAIVADAIDAAARSARRRGATGIAAELTETAATLTPTDQTEVRLERMTRAGRWFAESGDVERGTALLDRVADEAPPGDTRARALGARSQIAGWNEGAGAAIATAERALDDAIDPALRVRLLLSLAFELDTVDLARAQAFADAAVAIVDTTPAVLGPTSSRAPDSSWRCSASSAVWAMTSRTFASRARVSRARRGSDLTVTKNGRAFARTSSSGSGPRITMTSPRPVPAPKQICSDASIAGTTVRCRSRRPTSRGST